MQPLRLSEATEENFQTRITRSLQVIQTGYVNYGPNVVNIEFTKIVPNEIHRVPLSALITFHKILA